MNRSLMLQIAGLTAGLFVAILGATLAHDQIVLCQVRTAIYQADRPNRVELMAFRQWKIDRAPAYPSLYSVIDNPGYPTQTSDVGSVYFERERPQYIKWAESQVP